jgi:separase
MFNPSRYFGHGAGEQHLKGSHVRLLNQCAVALLFGCSSGFLKPAGEFDPVGAPLDYLIAGRYCALNHNIIDY